MSDLISRKAAIDAVHCRVELANKIEAMAMTSAIAEITRNIASLPSAEAVQGWIPCSERLPEKGQLCICADGNSVTIDRYKGEEPPYKWAIYLGDYEAWMPLPEPYKGGDTNAD